MRPQQAAAWHSMRVHMQARGRSAHCDMERQICWSKPRQRRLPQGLNVRFSARLDTSVTPLKSRSCRAQRMQCLARSNAHMQGCVC